MENMVINIVIFKLWIHRKRKFQNVTVVQVNLIRQIPFDLLVTNEWK